MTPNDLQLVCGDTLRLEINQGTQVATRLRTGTERPKRFLLVAVAITWIAMFFFLNGSALAQGTTSVLGGKVFDPSGAVVTNASVTVVSDDTGVQWTAKTNDAGNWRVDGLIAGNYHFDVKVEGFEVLNYATFGLRMADQRFIDVHLKVGSSSASITVTAETPLLDTTAAVSGTVLTSEDFNELPTMTNNPIEFVRLTPGVYMGDTSGGNAFLWSNDSMSNITTNGSGSGTNAMNYTLDGATNSINSNGEVAFIPPMDAIQELRVTTNAYDASIERTAAGTVNLTMKSGGKDFHGSLYERNMNDFMNSNYYQNKLNNVRKPTVRANEYGGTVGGPVWIPKLYNGKKRDSFFFVSYDGIRNVSPSATGTMSLPYDNERNGDFSQSYTTNTTSGVTTTYPLVIYDWRTADSTGERSTVFPNATIPSELMSKMAKAIMALIPMPNKPSDGQSTDSNNFMINSPKIDKFWSLAVRGDNAWNNNHHTYVEYRHNNLNELTSDPFGPDNELVGNYLYRINDGVTVNHVWVIRPSLFATINANMTSWKTVSSSKGAGLDAAKYDFSSNLISQQTAGGVPYLDIFGGLGNTSGPSYQNDYTYEVRGNLTQTWKNHTFHYGGVYMTQQEASGDKSGGPGHYSFGNNWTVENPNKTAGPGIGSTTASFLMGMPTSGYENNGTTAFYSQPFVGVYVQDDWRVTPKLTLNLGVRWDDQLSLVERHDKYYTRFDPNYDLTQITDYIQPRYASVIAGSSTSLGVQVLQQYRSDTSTFVARGAVLYAGLNGTSRSITDSQPKYIQPRIGFAYQIHPNTVLRGGVGRFVQSNYVANHANQTGYSSQTPFDVTEDDFITPKSTLDNPYPTGLVPLTGNTLGVYTNAGNVGSYYTSDIKRQYTDDVSLHLEQQVRDYLFELGGVFEYTNGLVVGYATNLPSYDAWQAAYGPKFDATGRPVDTLPGDTKVTNPFRSAPYINTVNGTNTTTSAWKFLRPSPLLDTVTANYYNGKSWHYALQAKAQRRFRDGFAIDTAFAWSKQMDETGYMTNAQVSQKLHRQLSGSDRRFQFTAAPTYVLPFGRGKLIGKHVNRVVNNFIGGWEISGTYIFWSGMPTGLPTNSTFFKGGDPSLGSKKTNQHWFDTSAFVAFPTVSTTYDQLHNKSIYPDWTGVQNLPGYNWKPTSASDSSKNGVYHDFSTWSTDNTTNFGDIRNPYTNNWTLGLRKDFKLQEGIKLQLRADAFNALNHPRWAAASTSATSKYFGYLNGSNTLSQSNDPRTIQLEGHISF